MEHLGIAVSEAVAWFVDEDRERYVLVVVPEACAAEWKARLPLALRRCYISDKSLKARAQELEGEVPETVTERQRDIIAAKLPDPGSVMAGDFGEIVAYIYQAAAAHPTPVIGPKKWRLKQDRRKPAPHSDVVQFVLPTWPAPSDQDEILCAEVKLKSTSSGSFSAIRSAIKGCETDRTSRLMRTLQWLKERALCEPVEAVRIAQLDRFINATADPPYKKRFRAIAIVRSDLVDTELADAPKSKQPHFRLVVISIPDLHTLYNAVFAAAKEALPPAEASQ